MLGKNMLGVCFKFYTADIIAYHRKKTTTHNAGNPGPGWDRHKNMADSDYHFGISKPSPLDSWICFSG
jgi:hypothetical protein